MCGGHRPPWGTRPAARDGEVCERVMDVRGENPAAPRKRQVGSLQLECCPQLEERVELGPLERRDACAAVRLDPRRALRPQGRGTRPGGCAARPCTRCSASSSRSGSPASRSPSRMRARRLAASSSTTEIRASAGRSLTSSPRPGAATRGGRTARRGPPGPPPPSRRRHRRRDRSARRARSRRAQPRRRVLRGREGRHLRCRESTEAAGEEDVATAVGADPQIHDEEGPARRSSHDVSPARATGSRRSAPDPEGRPHHRKRRAASAQQTLCNHRVRRVSQPRAQCEPDPRHRERCVIHGGEREGRRRRPSRARSRRATASRARPRPSSARDAANTGPDPIATTAPTPTPVRETASKNASWYTATPTPAMRTGRSGQ